MYPSGPPSLVSRRLLSQYAPDGPKGYGAPFIRAPMIGNSPSPTDLGAGGSVGSGATGAPPGYELDPATGLFVPLEPGSSRDAPSFSAVYDSTRFGYIQV